MEPWYQVATPRAEVREGRFFNPDEFSIARKLSGERDLSAFCPNGSEEKRLLDATLLAVPR